MKHHPASPDYRNRFNLIGWANFDPTTMIVLSTAMSAVGAIQEGSAQASAYKREAAVNEENARIARLNAERTSQAYSLQEDKLRRSQKLALGQQRAAAAESGVGVTTGSNLDIQVEDSAQAELDALTLRYDGQNERNNLLNQGIQFSNAAATSRTNAKTAKQSGYTSALTSVVGGATKYSQYKDMMNQYKAPNPAQSGGAPITRLSDWSY